MHPQYTTPALKRCSKCGQTKPLEHFYKRKDAPDGHGGFCLLCRNDYEVARNRSKPELAKVRAARYRTTHREQTKQATRISHAKKLDYYLAQRADYRKRNREMLRAKGRHYVRTHLSQQATRTRNRRRKMQNAPGRHTQADVKRQYKAQKGCCYWCKAKVGNNYHVDHVIPISRGGSNGADNIVIACPTCNHSRGARLPHEWPQGGRLL